MSPPTLSKHTVQFLALNSVQGVKKPSLQPNASFSHSYADKAPGYERAQRPWDLRMGRFALFTVSESQLASQKCPTPTEGAQNNSWLMKYI